MYRLGSLCQFVSGYCTRKCRRTVICVFHRKSIFAWGSNNENNSRAMFYYVIIQYFIGYLEKKENTFTQSILKRKFHKQKVNVNYGISFPSALARRLLILLKSVFMIGGV